MKLFANMKIGSKLILGTTLILLVSIVTITLAGYTGASNGLEDRINVALTNRASDIGANVSSNLANLNASVNGIAAKIRIVSMDWTQQKPALLEDLSRLGYKNIGVATLNGEITFVDETAANISDRNYFIKALEEKTIVSDPLINKITEEIVVAIASPIFVSGKVVGVVVATVDYDIISNMISNVREADTGYAFMINKAGTTIAHPNKELVKSFDNDFESVKSDPELQELVDLEKRMVNGENGVGQYSYNKVTKYMSFAPVVGTDWFVAITAPESELFKAIHDIARNSIILAVVFLIIAVIITYFLSLVISRPIKKLVTIADQIANGNLDITVDDGSKDETGQLANAFKRMSDKLNEVMSNINVAAEQVASGSHQVSDSSIALSGGATEQASAIEQLTASIEEISSHTKLNAENANQANILASEAKVNAVQGDDQMSAMITAMEEINESSQNISKIIKVIDDIAFQTNILALNAAVEAARAGQYGRGFAVVAEEVRNLAARSANAARETTDMIEGSIKKVNIGTKIANETEIALTKIVDGVDKVATLVENIAAASNEQSLGLEQINQGVMQVSQVVQTNSATSEESAAASEELSGQADLLKSQVATFKLRRSAHNLSYVEKPVYSTPLETNTETREEFIPQAKSVSRIILSDNELGKY